MNKITTRSLFYSFESEEMVRGLYYSFDFGKKTEELLLSVLKGHSIFLFQCLNQREYENSCSNGLWARESWQIVAFNCGIRLKNGESR